MYKVLLLVSLAVIVSGQYGGVDYNGIPNPYEFSYSSPSEGGSSSHQESGDGQGRVTGSYSVNNEDGTSRTVHYVADEGGFRASVTTNEPGTSNQSPADVTMNSSADDGLGGGISYGAGPGAVGVAAPAVGGVAYTGGASYGGGYASYGGGYGGGAGYGAGGVEVVPTSYY